MTTIYPPENRRNTLDQQRARPLANTAGPSVVYAPEILQEPMRRVCSRLAGIGIDLASYSALEFFAREGNWQTLSYASLVARLDAWELDPHFESALRHNLPNARIRIGNSFELAKSPQFAGQFDFIVYDNPQMIFGDRHQYCEHFEALETLPHLMKQRAVVLFDINREPFDYELFPDWQKRRNEFYQVADASRLDEDFLMAFYNRYFHDRALTSINAFIEPRHAPYFAYFVAVLQKRDPTSSSE